MFRFSYSNPLCLGLRRGREYVIGRILPTGDRLHRKRYLFGYVYTPLTILQIDVNYLIDVSHDVPGRDGVAKATFKVDPEQRLLISRVPKTRLRLPQTETIRKPLREANQYYVAQKIPILMNGIGMMRDNITHYNALPINGKLNTTICQQDFCCNFEVSETHVDSSVNYRAVIYKDGRLFGDDIKTGIRVCAVVQCLDDSLVSCTGIDPTETEFTVLKVSTTFDDHSQLLVTPNSLNSSMLPFGQWTYAESMEGNRKTFAITLNKPTKHLSAFGIYVRDFGRDRVLTTGFAANSSAPNIIVSFVSISMSFLCLYVLKY